MGFPLFHNTQYLVCLFLLQNQLGVITCDKKSKKDLKKSRQEKCQPMLSAEVTTGCLWTVLGLELHW